MADQYEDMEDLPESPEADRNSKPWLDMLKGADKCFEAWQEKSDNIDKMYADMDRLAQTSREREFQIFWANMEVLKPSIGRHAAFQGLQGTAAQGV